jgi:hypothetical protein
MLPRAARSASRRSRRRNTPITTPRRAISSMSGLRPRNAPTDGRSRFQAFGSPRIRPNQLGLADLVLLGSPPEVSNLHVGGERLHVQRGEPETIMVSSVPFRRGGTVVSRLAEIIDGRTQTFHFLTADALGKLLPGGHNVVDPPVSKHTRGGIRIFDDQCEALCPGRRIRPLQGRREVLPSAVYFCGIGSALPKAGLFN